MWTTITASVALQTQSTPREADVGSCAVPLEILATNAEHAIALTIRQEMFPARFIVLSPNKEGYARQKPPWPLRTPPASRKTHANGAAYWPCSNCVEIGGHFF